MRRAQHEASRSPEVCVALARRFVAGKLQNSRAMLLRGARETEDADDQARLRDAAHEIARSIGDLPNAPSLDVVRGIEGAAGRAYFGALTSLVRSDRAAFAMEGRSRRPPRSRANALLSFGYALLLNACRSAVEAVGLDPQIGFLHDVRPGRPALALDLMEEFRPVVADRLVLSVVNRRQLGVDEFDLCEGGGVLLTERARKTFLEAWEKRRQEEIVHPELDQRMPLGVVPLVQARLLARAVRADAEYVPFVPR